MDDGIPDQSNVSDEEFEAIKREAAEAAARDYVATSGGEIDPGPPPGRVPPQPEELELTDERSQQLADHAAVFQFLNSARIELGKDKALYALVTAGAAPEGLPENKRHRIQMLAEVRKARKQVDILLELANELLGSTTGLPMPPELEVADSKLVVPTGVRMPDDITRPSKHRHR